MRVASSSLEMVPPPSKSTNEKISWSSTISASDSVISPSIAGFVVAVVVSVAAAVVASVVLPWLPAELGLDEGALFFELDAELGFDVGRDPVWLDIYRSVDNGRGQEREREPEREPAGTERRRQDNLACIQGSPHLKLSDPSKTHYS